MVRSVLPTTTTGYVKVDVRVSVTSGITRQITEQD